MPSWSLSLTTQRPAVEPRGRATRTLRVAKFVNVVRLGQEGYSVCCFVVIKPILGNYSLKTELLRNWARFS